MLTVGVVALGVTDVERAADFWTAALGYRRLPRPFAGWANVLEPSAGPGTRLALQLSDTPPPDHPRIHLDLHTEDPATEVARLLSLGATRVDWDSYPADPDFVVLADPDGNRFCVVDLLH